MSKFIRWSAYFVGTLLVLSLVFSVAVMILIDPNEYKDDIANAVSDATGRSFTITGDLELTTFPCCGVVLGALTLGNPQGFAAGDFAAADAAAVDIQLWPLLTRQELLIGAIELAGLQLNLVKRADGAGNWVFTSSETAAATDNKTATRDGGLRSLDIAGISVSNGRISYLDETSAEPASISNIELATGAIATGQPFDVAASFAVDGLAQTTAANFELAAQADFDDTNWTVDLHDVQGELSLTGNELPGGNAQAAVSVEQLTGLGADLVQLEGLTATVTAGQLTVQLRGAGTLVGTEPDLAGTLVVEAFSPRELLAALGRPVNTADPEVLDRMQAAAEWRLTAQRTAAENIELTLDDSKAQGWIRIKDLAARALAFNMQLDALDLDRYLPPPEDEPGTAGKSSAAAADSSPEPAFDNLRTLNLQGRIRVGKLKFADARLSDVDITVQAQDGLLRLNPLTANLYQGGYAGDVRFDVRGAQAQLAVNEQLTDVQLGELLTDTRGQENLTGTGSARIKATARGDSIDELLSNLVGEASVSMLDGVYNGVDIWYEIRKARAKLKSDPPPPRPEQLFTDISQLSGSARFDRGVISNDNFVAQIPFIQLRGNGTADLPQSLMNYRLEAQVIGEPTFEDGEVLDDLEGLVLPINLQGDMNSPSVTVDIGAVATSIAERKLRERLRKKFGIE